MGKMMARVLQHRTLLFRCAMLQLLDMVTTLFFLARGVAEANPLVKWSIGMAHGSVAGLLAVKIMACVLSVMAVQSGRTAVVERMNRFFIFLAAWNFLALLLSFQVR